MIHTVFLDVAISPAPPATFDETIFSSPVTVVLIVAVAAFLVGFAVALIIRAVKKNKSKGAPPMSDGQ